MNINQIDISIIICCYNSENRIAPTLNHLSKQKIENLNCELILIDNDCEDNTVNLAKNCWELFGNPFELRVIKESNSGLSYARKTGIINSKGGLIIFCDDDNWLNSDYLLSAYSISINYPYLGVWGGAILPVFEVTPPKWKLKYINYLAVRKIDQIKWSNSFFSSDCEPWGAGLCIRKIHAIQYIKNTLDDTIILGRNKNRLLSGEDTDLVYNVLKNGAGMGLFPCLILKHYLPIKRFDDEYLLNIISGMTYSRLILNHKWGLDLNLCNTYELKSIIKLFFKLISYSSFEKKLLIKNILARRDARRDIALIKL